VHQGRESLFLLTHYPKLGHPKLTQKKEEPKNKKRKERPGTKARVFGE
jgi:hypothetical protein